MSLIKKKPLEKIKPIRVQKAGYLYGYIVEEEYIYFRPARRDIPLIIMSRTYRKMRELVRAKKLAMDEYKKSENEPIDDGYEDYKE